jgi:hypothetical protein
MFWDRFIQRLFAAFSSGNRALLVQAGRLVQLGVQLGLINPNALSDSSIVRCLICCPPDGSLQAAAFAQYISRGLNRAAAEPIVTRALLFSRPIDLNPMALMGRGANSEQRLPLIAGLWGGYRPPLRKFLSRLFLVDYNHPVLDEAGPEFMRALITFWAGGPTVPDDFPCHLYRRIRAWARTRPLGVEIAEYWPDPPPAWYEDIEPEERAFLSCCLELEPEVRELVYLLFYALLDVQRITCVLRGVNEDWTVPEVASLLTQAIEAVLRCMRGRLGSTSRPSGSTN